MTLDLLLEQFDGLIQTPADVKKLEQTILQWAVMGRLVPQDRTDEPASVLLERIKAEKARLVKEKKIRKGKKLPPIKADEVPFEIPNGWQWARFGPCIELISGQHIKNKDYNNNGIGIPYLTGPSDFGKLHPIISKWTAKPKAVAHIGNILITVKGSGLGKLNIVNKAPIAISRQLMAIQPIYLVTKYVYIFLKSKHKYFQESGIGIAIPGIGRKDVREMLFPLPPIEQQKRIVVRVDQLFEQTRTLSAQLEAAEEARTRLQRAVVAEIVSKTPLSAPAISSNRQTTDVQELLIAQFDALHTRPADVKALKQTILQLGVMGRLVPQDPNDEPASVLLERIKAEKARLVKEKKIKKGKKLPPITADEVPFEVPSEWEWCKLNEILLFMQTGPFGSNLHKSEYVPDGIPVINPSDMKDGKISTVKAKMVSNTTLERLASYVLKKGDVIMARRGEMGRCAPVTEVEDGWLCGTGSVILGLSTFTYQEFIVKVIESEFTRDYLRGGSVGATMNNLNQKVLLNLSFPLPPIEEQKRIVARVNELFALCDELAAGLERAEAMRERVLDAALAQAVRG